MDQLLFFLLFILFSIISALLDRRRRRQSLEEARSRREATQKKEPAPAKSRDEDEGEEGNWPWPEIFEQAPTRPWRAEPERTPAEVVVAEAPAAEANGEGRYRRADEELREMERRVREMEERARQADRLSLEEFRRMEEQAAARMGSGTAEQDREPARHRQAWSLTPREARRALVYAEILGPPKSERRE
jgi:hypothetical protein